MSLVYTLHHYGAGSVSSGFTFAFCASDKEALAEARNLLEQQGLRCVEVCDGSREVGSVS